MIDAIHGYKKIQDIHCSAHTTKSKALTNRHIHKIYREHLERYAFLDNLFVTTMSFFFFCRNHRTSIDE